MSPECFWRDVPSKRRQSCKIPQSLGGRCEDTRQMLRSPGGKKSHSSDSPKKDLPLRKARGGRYARQNWQTCVRGCLRRPKARSLDPDMRDFWRAARAKKKQKVIVIQRAQQSLMLKSVDLGKQALKNWKFLGYKYHVAMQKWRRVYLGCRHLLGLWKWRVPSAWYRVHKRLLRWFRAQCMETARRQSTSQICVALGDNGRNGAPTNYNCCLANPPACVMIARPYP